MGSRRRASTAVSHYGPQEGALRRGVDILVATVGRVIDHIDRGNLQLNDAYHVVLDEADEMLSMGFADDVERIFGECPAGKAKGMGSGGGAPVPDDAFDLDELLGEEAPPAQARKKKCGPAPAARRSRVARPLPSR